MRCFLLVSLFIFVFSTLNGCGVIARSIKSNATRFSNSQLFHQGRHGKLNEKEMQWAKTAWQYFANNYNPQTGLVNGSDQYPVASLWHIADTLAAFIAAYKLGLLDDYQFDHQISPLLGFLNEMPLSFGKLPNRYYHTQSGKMVDAGAKDSDIGWSAVDIGRLLIWLRILRADFPRYSEYVDKAVLRWRFCKLINDCGRLYGGVKNSQYELTLYPEKAPGYLQYALMGYAVWGFKIPSEENLVAEENIRIYDVEIPYDTHAPRSKSGNPLVSLPYILQGLEFNWDKPEDKDSDDTRHTSRVAADMAEKIYRVQERRYQYERIFTARTDHPNNSEPYFLYDTVFGAGYAWNTLTPEGQFEPDLALVSTRAAFGMWALWKTPYTDMLVEVVSELYHPKRGWFEGRYEKTGAHNQTFTVTTNALVLQALLHKTQGKLYRVGEDISYAKLLLQDEFRRPPCFPVERDACPVPPSDKLGQRVSQSLR